MHVDIRFIAYGHILHTDNGHKQRNKPNPEVFQPCGSYKEHLDTKHAVCYK